MIKTILYPVIYCEAVIFDFTEEQNEMIEKMSNYQKAELLFKNLTEEEQTHTSITRIYEYLNAGLFNLEPHKGICRICGCTMDNACSSPTHGNCWWVDETETLCSHCAYEEIKFDPATKGPRGVRILKIKENP